VSCNNRINPGKAFHSIGTTVPTTARALRASEILGRNLRERRPITAQGMKEMQNDVIDEFAKAIVPILKRLIDRHKLNFDDRNSTSFKILEKIATLLDKWNYQMMADSKFALVYNLLWEELYGMMLHKTIPDQFERESATHGFFSDYFLLNMIAEWGKGRELNSEYCANKLNEGKGKKCVWNVIQAAVKVYETVVKECGEDDEKWRWSQRHLLEYPHVPFSDVGLLRPFFHKEAAAPVLNGFQKLCREIRTHCTCQATIT